MKKSEEQKVRSRERRFDLLRCGRILARRSQTKTRDATYDWEQPSSRESDPSEPFWRLNSKYEEKEGLNGEEKVLRREEEVVNIPRPVEARLEEGTLTKTEEPVTPNCR